MTDPAVPTPAPVNPFDARGPFLLSLFMTLVGYSVLVALPAINGAWVDQLGFTDVQVNRVASADLLGLFIGAVLTSVLIRTWDRQKLTYLGIALAIIANALCTQYVDYETTLILRLLAGLGSGFYTAVAVAGLGAHSRPREAFNWMLLAFAISQFLELQLIPHLTMNGIYVFFIATYVVTLPFVRVIPKTSPPLSPTDAPSDTQKPTLLAWIGIGAIVIAYINIGAYWSNIELAAEAAGIDGDWAAQVIAWCVLLSFVGCFTAMWVLKKFDYDRPLLFTFVLMVIAVGLLAINFTAAVFVLSVAMFNFLWIFIDVYQMGGVSVADRSGSAAAFIPGAQGLGQTVGPFAASIMLELGWGFDGVFVLCAAASAGALLIYTLIYLRFRHHPA
ncbi:MAG: YbfB/YjiJ family MFS transporter [Luminiphilus sp.]|nr:YbfB/YjiJ family MFS transporter [Luminiphilus sp.]